MISVRAFKSITTHSNHYLVTVDQVNTERVPTENNGMHHSVGGWPKEYDYQEQNEVNKYMRKLVKEPQMCFG